jgi:hypothetical protein
MLNNNYGLDRYFFKIWPAFIIVDLKINLESYQPRNAIKHGIYRECEIKKKMSDIIFIA